MTESTHIFQKMIKKYEYYLIKYDFKFVFSNYEDCPHLKCDHLNNNIIFSWQKVLKEGIDDYKDKGYTFDRIDEMNIITIADKWICQMIPILNIICVLMNGNYLV